ncbi:MAG TPA: hypothetical protein VNX46_06755 [Candidatus Acidoferrum sp.]|jgi:hypothetical protein|nr:hypothetical protein [Candidatus Acidoferrum sp.]
MKNICCTVRGGGAGGLQLAPARVCLRMSGTNFMKHITDRSVYRE